MPRKAQGSAKSRKPSTKGSKLSLNHEHFCQVYIETGSATEAYLRAVAGDKTMNRYVAGVCGCQLLKSPKIQARISTLYQPTLDRYEVTADKVVRELAKLAFSNLQDYMSVDSDGLPRLDLSAIDRDQAAAISEVTCEIIRTEREDGSSLPVLKAKIKLADKRASLVELGKLVGVISSTVNVKGDVKHTHEHNHRAEPLSDSAGWVEGLLGAGQGSAASKSRAH